MINTTVSALVALKPFLQQLAQTEMSAKESFKVLRMLKIIDKEYENIETIQMRVFDNYGLKDENGQLIIEETGNVAVNPEKMNEFNSELNELFSSKISLNCDKINISMLDNIPISPFQLMRFEDFIEE